MPTEIIYALEKPRVKKYLGETHERNAINGNNKNSDNNNVVK